MTPHEQRNAALRKAASVLLHEFIRLESHRSHRLHLLKQRAEACLLDDPEEAEQLAIQLLDERERL